MKAAIAGATGFIGQHLLAQLESDDSYSEIAVLSRKELDLSDKFNLLIGNISELKLPEVEVAFCALGTTIATAGSQDAFYQVDHDMVIEFAKKARSVGARTLVLVSSVGAEANSKTFYLKVKGETEEDLKSIGFESLIILRPSMLMGNRKEFRLGELIGKGAMTIFNPLLIGGMAKYRGIQGETVAKAMAKLGKETLPGIHVLEGEQLFAFGDS